MPDDPALPDVSRPGAVAPDAPHEGGWLLNDLGGDPVLLAIGGHGPLVDGCRVLEIDDTPVIRERYLGEAPSALYLIRPDQVIAGRWMTFDEEAIGTCLKRLWEGGA